MSRSVIQLAGAVFLLGALTSFAVIPLIRRWAMTRAILDLPTEGRKIHTEAVPRIGGAAIYLGFVLIFLFVGIFLPRQVSVSDGWEQIFLVTTPMFLLGLWDDFRPLGAKKKLIGQILISMFAYFIGMRIENVTDPFTHAPHNLGVLGFFCTVIWIVGITNLINLIDGLDGLAAGVSLFLMLVMAALATLKSSLPLFCLSVGMVGVLAGFLFFNFPPAKIFLGDGGAYFLGSLIASVALVNSSKGELVAAMVVPFFALGLPVLDTALAIVRRGILGLPISRGDRQHIHHRLLDMGFSQRRTVVLLYLICTFLCLVAAVFFVAGSRWWAVLLGVLFTVAILSVRGLGYVKSWDRLGLQLAGSVEKRRTAQMALLLGRVLVLEAETCNNWEDFRRLVGSLLERMGFHFLAMQSSVPEMERFEWKPSRARPWEIETAEWVEQKRAIRAGREVLGTIKIAGYVAEDYLDHFHRLADILGESIEEGFRVCYRKFEL